jgi:hypothetical protein
MSVHTIASNFDTNRPSECKPTYAPLTAALMDKVVMLTSNLLDDDVSSTDIHPLHAATESVALILCQTLEQEIPLHCPFNMCLTCFKDKNGFKRTALEQNGHYHQFISMRS